MSNEKEPHSLLNSLHKEYLEHHNQPGDGKTTLRQLIRDRVQRGLHDFVVLNQYARDTDIEQIFYRKDELHDTDGNESIPDTRDIMIQAHWVPVRHMIAFAWRGLRANGMEKQEIFERAIVPAIEEGEAEHKNSTRENVESEISLETLEVHRGVSQLEPLEKFDRGLALTGEEWQELYDQLNQELDRDIRDENLNELIEEHLIDG